MLNRLILAAVLLTGLSGCVAIPRIELAQHFEFNAPLPNRTPMSYDDLLCCYECNA